DENSSAKAFGVMACAANKSRIALLVGSAMAQNTSRLVSMICNYLIANISATIRLRKSIRNYLSERAKKAGKEYFRIYAISFERLIWAFLQAFSLYERD